MILIKTKTGWAFFFILVFIIAGGTGLISISDNIDWWFEWKPGSKILFILLIICSYGIAKPLGTGLEKDL